LRLLFGQGSPDRISASAHGLGVRHTTLLNSRACHKHDILIPEAISIGLSRLKFRLSQITDINVKESTNQQNRSTAASVVTAAINSFSFG
jgi:hypothetical protein